MFYAMQLGLRNCRSRHGNGLNPLHRHVHIVRHSCTYATLSR